MKTMHLIIALNDTDNFMLQTLYYKVLKYSFTLISISLMETKKLIIFLSNNSKCAFL